MARWTRRNVLKGFAYGSAVTVGLPLLDCFLDGNGAALASGARIPTRFGTWFWGCGVNAARWIPDSTFGTSAWPSGPLRIPPELPLGVGIAAILLLIGRGHGERRLGIAVGPSRAAGATL